MNLPLVFDIATGLIFIYLILSLLASEIQELIATLLQWRAEHLKKSIEVLIGGSKTTDPNSQYYADSLYSTPTIQALNQEAKGPLAHSFRSLLQRLGDSYRRVTGTRNVFGNERSGPSYIPASAFAAAITQKLDLESVSYKTSELTLKRFTQERMAQVQDLIDALRNSMGNDSLLEAELIALRRTLTEIYDDLINHRTTLSDSMDTATQQFSYFVDNTETVLGQDHHCETIIRQRLPYLKQVLQLRRIQPTVSEILAIAIETAQNPPSQVRTAVGQLKRSTNHLPEPLQKNLMALAQRAQTRSKGVEDGIRQMEQEVEVWFNHSMERASGVYKRNAKGIAILIGVAIAAATNTDTFHIVSRLSKDGVLRFTLSEAANQSINQYYYPYGNYPRSASPYNRFQALDPLGNPLEDPLGNPLEDPLGSPDEDDSLNSLPNRTPSNRSASPGNRANDLPPDIPLEESNPSSLDDLFRSPDRDPATNDDPAQVPFLEDDSAFPGLQAEEFDPRYNPIDPDAIQQDLDAVRIAVDNSLNGLSLPIGWNQVNQEQQELDSAGWRVPILRRIIGWFISGIALSMGASFWFDVLSKVMRVRNAGRPTQNSNS